MAPKAYDPYNNYDETSGKDALLEWGRGLSAGEWIALISVTNLFCIASFQAGYLDNIPGHFADLFSLSDLIGSNLSVLQFIFSVVSLYYFVWMLIGWLLKKIWNRMKEKIESFIRIWVVDLTLVVLTMFIVVIVGSLLNSLADSYSNSPLLMYLLPSVLYQAVWPFVFWVALKHNLMTVRTFIYIILLNLAYFSNNAGHGWLRYDMHSPKGVQAMTINGECYERKILRANSSGYLLFNPVIKQFEFRAKDEVKVIFDKPGCA